MFKAIIVDDEKWIVEGIKAAVNWGEYGFEVVGSAENGQEALKQIESLNPDIVLTDIKMPLMNGLELIKKGKEISPLTLFVVLSGHAEFAYAQKALNYGTFGYCLKPFEIEEIHSMLSRLSQTLKARINDNSSSFSSSFELYEAICTGDLLSLKRLLEAKTMPLSSQTKVTPIVIQRMGNLQLDNNIRFLSFQMNRQRNGYLVKDNHCRDFLHQLSTLNQPNEFSAGIGYPVSDVSEIEASLEHASLAAYGIFSTGKVGFHHPPAQSEITIEERLKEIDHALHRKDRVQFLSTLQSTKNLFHNGTLSIKDAYQIFTSVMYLFSREGVRNNNRFFEGYEQLYAYFGRADAMIDYLIDQTQDYFTGHHTARIMNVSHKKVKEILHYIHDHFNQEISIQSLSEKFYLSPNYLCQLFKKEVGENFVEYLSALRIQYACKLLSETSLSINQIGEKSGFNDYFYFTRIFKRINNMTPTQYRETQ